ncbi:hypothetical protein M0802_010777 [Mischocyttarus mexicanus]|nr:hypothetical protein M0802_010777 [Mischocyttarus mexicanus]
MLRISRTKHMTNLKVMKRMGKDAEIRHEVKKRKLQYLSHIMRSLSLRIFISAVLSTCFVLLVSALVTKAYELLRLLPPSLLGLLFLYKGLGDLLSLLPSNWMPCPKNQFIILTKVRRPFSTQAYLKASKEPSTGANLCQVNKFADANIKLVTLEVYNGKVLQGARILFVYSVGRLGSEWELASENGTYWTWPHDAALLMGMRVYVKTLEIPTRAHDNAG